MKCQCEHAAHFLEHERVQRVPAPLTPNGNPGHRYGQDFSDLFIVGVRTPYGTFSVCKDCARDCYQDYERI